VLPRQGRPGTDYVIVARAATGERAYAELVTDLETALRQLDRNRKKRPPARRSWTGRGGVRWVFGAAPALAPARLPDEAHFSVEHATLIRAYQLIVAPILPPSCRFYPKLLTLRRRGRRTARAMARFAARLPRLLRCHPWGGSGYDPVPPEPSR